MNEPILSPITSYFIGFAQTDGHLQKNTRNRGKLTFELSIKDIDIIHKLAALIPYNHTISVRIRKTNFKDVCACICLTIHDLEFRTFINALGVPYGNKSKVIKPPTISYSEVDYWRGVIDGDGSLGFTADGRPFISLVSSSTKLIRAYEDFLFRITGAKRHANRNNRDQVYNEALFDEAAKLLATTLYYEGCLGLNRKVMLANNIGYWINPGNRHIGENHIVVSNKSFTDYSDNHHQHKTAAKTKAK
jgi:hypothetical protein